jgi:hypothetical protein
MNVIINIISIVLSILSLFGLIFLTQLAFNATPTDKTLDTVFVTNFSNNKLTISKITLVLIWIQLILSLVITIYAIGAASN